MTDTTPPSPPGPLGIIAGGGALPAALADAAAAAGHPVVLVGLAGHADAALRPRCALWARLGAAGAILRALRRGRARDLVLIGSVRRPTLADWADLRPDWTALCILARLSLGRGGDDALLRRLRAVLEREGFALHPVQAFLPDLLAPAGVLGTHAPDSSALADIARGLAAARALGAQDVGQAVVVQGGVVLGVEGVEGTAALIARCGPLARPGTPRPVLCKCSKPGQDRALDLPTIGPETVAACAAAGFAGIAVEAGGVLIAGLDETVQVANGAGLFLYGSTA